jgi:hypothetical protein
MPTTTLTRNPIKDCFIHCLQGYIDSGDLTREQGNLFYTTLLEQEDLIKDILYRERPENEGNDNQFVGFEFASSPESFERIVSECEIDGEEPYVDVHSNFDGFSIYLVDAHQDDDDVMNYPSPRGEDTWHRTILFKVFEL